MIYNYYIYIMTNQHRTVLYTGVTNSLTRRVGQHREGKDGTFTATYNVNRLVYWEAFVNIRNAISREKEIKGWRREKKLALVNTLNPEWNDLGDTFLDLGPAPKGTWKPHT